MQISDNCTKYLQSVTENKAEYVKNINEITLNEIPEIEYVKSDDTACILTISKEALALFQEESDSKAKMQMQESDSTSVISGSQNQGIDYVEELKRLKGKVTNIYNNTAPMTSQEIDDERLELAEEQRKLKELEEQEERRLEEARREAKDDLLDRQQLNQNVSDLLMILECLEASEKEEEEQKDHKENATKKDMPSSDITALNMSKDAFGDSSIGKSEDLDNEYTTSEAVAKQASQVVNSALARDLHCKSTLDGFATRADASMKAAHGGYVSRLKRLDDAIVAMSDKNFDTDKERENEYMSAFLKMDLGNYEKQVANAKQRNIYAREYGIEQQGIAPMVAAVKIQEDILEVSGDAFINESADEVIEKTGEDVAEIVKEKIDERNDIDSEEEAEEPTTEETEEESEIEEEIIEKEGRLEDLKQSIQDKEYQQQLLKEYNI